MRYILFCLIFPSFINAQTALIAGNDTVCDNELAKLIIYFSGGSPPYTFVHAVNGVDRDPITTNSLSYTLNTKDSGFYTLTSFYDDTGGGIISGSGLVTHLISPKAYFTASPDSTNILNTKTQLTDNSISYNNIIVNSYWEFGDGNSFSYVSPNWKDTLSYKYPNEQGIYQIRLIIQDDQGCTDTAQNLIVISDFYSIFIPNSFSPDLDGINDRFCLVYSGIRENTFLFRVFNSQLDLIYQSVNPAEMQCSSNGGWDGTHYSTLRALPSDTYIYDISYQDFEGWKHQEYGKIILVR